MNNTLASSTRKPGIYVGFDTTLASRNLPANPQRLLLMGQRRAAGTVAALVATAVFSDSDAAGYFGAGSQLHLMCRAAIKANPLLDLTAIALDDAGAGVLATGTLTLTGPATAAGILSIWIGMRNLQVAVANGDTATNIAANLNTALAGYSDLPVTAGAAAGIVTLTAKNKGTCGNGIKVALDAGTVLPAGVTATIVAMANGAGDPDITNALTAIFPVRYNLIATQFNDATNLGLLRTHLDTVSGKIEQRGARGYFGYTGILSAAITLATGFNFERFSCAYSRGNRALACEIAAGYAAYRASVDDPSMPLDGDVLPGISIPPLQSDWLSRTEQESCLHNALTPLVSGTDNQLHIVRAITTYMTAGDNTPDDTLLDDNPIPILDYVRDVVRAIPKPKKATVARAAGYRDLIYTQLKKLEAAEILMNIDLYKDRLQVIANPTDRPVGWFKVTIPAPYVPGLHILDETIELYL
jgi:phage tail sheath gpL-like